MLSNILVIDDDKFIHKVIVKALEPEGFVIASALDGRSGIDAALASKPDIILLDVEMPGANGYEVCEEIRSNDNLTDIAIVFLSSQCSLRERLQGYEVGADDYLTKPFESEHLVARLNVLGKYQEERKEMQAKYQLAQKTALTALIGTSEISLVMQFMEKIMGHNSVEEVAMGLIEITDKFSIDCCLCIAKEHTENAWYSSDGTVSPIEKELVEMSDKSTRFLDFGCRTVIHFAPASMLVRNMPLEDMDKYGRIKDLLPVLLSVVNSKLSSIETYVALIEQSEELRLSFRNIKKQLFQLASTIVENRQLSTSLSENCVQDLNMKLMSMSLEMDQETYILSLLETALTDTLEAQDMGGQLRASFTYILENLTDTMNKHDNLLTSFIDSQEVKETIQDDGDDVELF